LAKLPWAQSEGATGVLSTFKAGSAFQVIGQSSRIEHMPSLAPNTSYLPGLPKYLSFVDEAGHAKDPSQHYLCLAGLLATEEAWKKFNDDWRNACRTEGLAEPFHMMDLAARKKQFKGWSEEKRQHLLGQLISAIDDARAIPIGSVVCFRGFNALPPDVSKGFRDPHFLAFQTLTYQIAVAASIAMEPGPATMVFAHHPEHSEGLASTAKLWEAVRKYNPIVRLFMESYVCGQPQEYPGLQAADLWAYELRHHFEVIRPAGRKPRWPFMQFVRLGLNYQFTHDFISYHDENGLSGLGKMSRVQRWGEIDLYRVGFVGVHPTEARKIDMAFRQIAADISGKAGPENRPLDADEEG
jgi:hypothetical protein